MADQNFSNRHVESNEPAFLRRLRAQHGDHDSSRHERPLARPKKQVQEGETEDQPTYVVEDSQDTLSKAEYEALVAANNADQQSDNDMPSSAKVRDSIEEAELGKGGATRESAAMKQQVAGIGCSTKRRLAKVVGEKEEEEDEAAPDMTDSGKKDKKVGVKKAKKMKLSFDEEGTEA